MSDRMSIIVPTVVAVLMSLLFLGLARHEYNQLQTKETPCETQRIHPD